MERITHIQISRSSESLWTILARFNLWQVDPETIGKILGLNLWSFDCKLLKPVTRKCQERFLIHILTEPILTSLINPGKILTLGIRYLSTTTHLCHSAFWHWQCPSLLWTPKFSLDWSVLNLYHMMDPLTPSQHHPHPRLSRSVWLPYWVEPWSRNTGLLRASSALGQAYLCPKQVLLQKRQQPSFRTPFTVPQGLYWKPLAQKEELALVFRPLNTQLPNSNFTVPCWVL